MKFVADVMLGKLAKKLRLLGFDVLYDQALDDNTALQLSLEQNRVLLTRDAALAKRPLARNHLLIEDDDPRQQLRQVLSYLSAASSPPPHPRPLTRCSACNGLLAPVSKSSVRDAVPAYVYRTRRSFLQCPDCKRIYWTGSHTKRMEQEEAQED